MMLRNRTSLLFLAATAYGAYSTALSEEVDCGWHTAALGPRAFDEKKGEDTVRYPPDRRVDVRHVKLELRFPNLQGKAFDGVETYTVRAIAPGVTSIELDAVDLRIAGVDRIEGPEVSHHYDGKKLVLVFAQEIPVDQDTSVRIVYRCEDPGEGLHFYLPDDRQPQRVPQVHSQGQTEHNRHWFPCHDSPNERNTTEMIVSAPSRFRVISNGKLLESRREGSHTVWHWRQDIPHVAYLVSLVIGEFAEITDTWRGIPVNYYVRPGEQEEARRAFANTPAMLDFFSDRFGVDYPYDQYVQVCVENFGAGGMENTSATTLYSGVPFDARAALDHDQDGLIAHELGHQWFGDLITCKSWSHVWLNEGFASFCDDLWSERQLGPDEHVYEKWGRYRGVAASDSSDVPGTLVLRDYEDAWDTFRYKGGQVYGKGSSILHMLRHQLGEEIFWRGFQDYVRTYKNAEVETDDFRKCMEAVAGESLLQFFEQWCERPGVPRLKVTYRWDHESGHAVVDVEQTQKVDRSTPAFNFPLDLYFGVRGKATPVTFQISKRRETYRQSFEAPPDLFCVDPSAGLLKEITIDMPRPLWLVQLRGGPTTAARCEAAVHLARDNRPEVVTALKETAADEKEFWGVRAQAAEALGQMQSDRALSALLELLERPLVIKHPKVRKRAVEALARYPSREVTEVLTRFAQSDPSYAVEAAATEALGNAVGEGLVDILLANAKKSSYRDQIRIAAVNALGKRRELAGLQLCMDIGSYGQPDRTRPSALAAIARMAQDDVEKTRAREFLLPMLHDPERRGQDGAIAALGELGDPEAIEALSLVRDSAVRKPARDAAAAAIARILSKQEEPVAIKFLRDELDALRKTRAALEERLDKLESAAPQENSPSPQEPAKENIVDEGS